MAEVLLRVWRTHVNHTCAGRLQLSRILEHWLANIVSVKDDCFYVNHCTILFYFLLEGNYF